MLRVKWNCTGSTKTSVKNSGKSIRICAWLRPGTAWRSKSAVRSSVRNSAIDDGMQLVNGVGDLVIRGVKVRGDPDARTGTKVKQDVSAVPCGRDPQSLHNVNYDRD